MKKLIDIDRAIIDEIKNYTAKSITATSTRSQPGRQCSRVATEMDTLWVAEELRQQIYLDRIANVLKDHPARENRQAYKWVIGHEAYVQLAKLKYPLDLGDIWVIEMRDNTPFMRGIEIETVPGSTIDLLPKITPMGWDGPNAPTRSD